MKMAATIFFSLVLLVLASLGTALAANITKSFEFGPGTPQPSSVYRTFPVPCGKQVAAVVKYRRLGTASTSGDILIDIELREPDTAPNMEGPLVKSEIAIAKTTEQTVTIFSPVTGSPRGCALPWRVRVKSRDAKPPTSVFGTIRMDYDGTVQNNSVPAFTGVLFKGESKTINFGTVAGFTQGKIELTANWHHQLTTVLPGPNAIRLEITLINPNGAWVATVAAYSSNEARTELTPFKLTYQVDKCLGGQWKLSIRNTMAQETVALDNATMKFTPGC
jgi:hypothetical protein